MVNSLKITYRKKSYMDGNIRLSHFALISNNGIILSKLKEDIDNKESISSTYHNFKNKKDYNEGLNKIKCNEDYMITKHEYNRLFKIFKNEFNNNCLI